MNFLPNMAQKELFGEGYKRENFLFDTEDSLHQEIRLFEMDAISFRETD